MMNKEKKKTYINEMKNVFNKTSSILVTHYQGLSVKQIEQLRSEMRKHGILFKITKNKITKLALEGTKFKKMENLFSGPTAVAFSDDPISSAKILTKFAKIYTNLKIIGGFMDNEPLEREDVAKIATLPTLDEARAKIVGILIAPAQKIMSILLAPGAKIAILAHAKSKKVRA
jgi:large subunit ribosomal protein L10